MSMSVEAGGYAPPEANQAPDLRELGQQAIEGAKDKWNQGIDAAKGAAQAGGEFVRGKAMELGAKAQETHARNVEWGNARMEDIKIV